jgi:hypothetical protein
MGVVEAKIQTAEEIYRLLWAAVAKRRPIAARLSRTPAAVLPWAGIKKAKCVYCAIGTAEKAKEDSSRPVRRPTGAAVYWRSSEE